MKGTEQSGTVSGLRTPEKIARYVEPVLMLLGGVSVPGAEILSFYAYTFTSVERILYFPIYVFV
jgi:hypothetical protein